MQEKEALSKCMAICSKAEKCVSDIQKKLDNWDVPEQLAARIIDELISQKFIDEDRFTKFYVRDKFRFNQWGKIKISFMLKSKGIHQNQIDDGLAEIGDQEYLETLQNLIQAKLKKIKFKDEYDKKSKLIRFAQSRGFEYDAISKVVD